MLIFLTAIAFGQDHEGHDHEGHNHAKPVKKNITSQRPVIELDPQMLHDYAGVYFWTPHRNHITVTVEDGKLYGQPETKEKNRLLAVDADEFVIENVGAELNFIRADDGLIKAMILLEDGELQEAPKLTPEQLATCTEEKHTHDLSFKGPEKKDKKS